MRFLRWLVRLFAHEPPPRPTGHPRHLGRRQGEGGRGENHNILTEWTIEETERPHDPGHPD
jgi:hypothetical protein